MYTETSLFLTMDKKTKRAVLTGKPGKGGVIYTRDFDTKDREYGWESYCMYQSAFSEEEYRNIIELYTQGQKTKALNLVKKKINDSEMQKNKLGPMGLYRLSDRVPDDWFDGCKTLLELLEYKQFVGIFTQDIQEFGIDYL